MRRLATALPAVAAVLVTVGLAGPAQAATTYPVVGTRVATATPSSTTYWTLAEGGATDGTYWYSAVLHNTNNDKTKNPHTPNYSSVQLLRTKLGASTPVSSYTYPVRAGNGSNLLGHANSMTYNNDTKQLVVPANNGDDSTKFANQSRTIRLISPSTLKIVASKVLANTTTAICYDTTHNRYVGRNGSSYYIYDSAFRQTGSFTVPATAMLGISQSIDCDQDYVYSIRSPDTAKGQKQNWIYVWTYTGKLVATYAYNSAAEGEDLTHSAGTYYASFNIGSGQLYRLSNFQYTVTYAANHGTGSMAPTVVLFGKGTTLRKNAYTRAGYRFGGWTAHRAVDNTSLYASPADSATIGWYADGTQPAGWKLSVYRDGAGVARTAPRGLVTLTAVWTAA